MPDQTNAAPPSASTSRTTPMQRSARTSVELRARGLHLLLRQLAVAPQERGELAGRLGDRLEAELRQALAELGRLHDLRRLGGELRDDVARRAGGRGGRGGEKRSESAQARLREGGGGGEQGKGP